MSDLSKYCVHIGERPSKRQFPLFQIILYAYIQSCDGSRDGYIIQSGDFPILYFVLLAINVCL